MVGSDDKPEESDTQTDYKAIAEDMRARLRILAREPQNITDLRNMINAAQELRWFEITTRLYDKDLQDQLNRVERGCD